MADVMHTVANLLAVANVDTAYRRRYLRRADSLLRGVLPPDEYEHLVRVRHDLEHLGHTADLAARISNWNELEEVARRAAALRSELAQRQGEAELRERLDGLPPVAVSPFSSIPGAVAVMPSRELERIRHEVVERLGELERRDPEYARFYALRRDHFEHLRFQREPTDGSVTATQRAAVEAEVRAALAAGDWQRVERTAHSLAALGRPGGRRNGGIGFGDTTDLADPFPTPALDGARRLGLSHVTVPDAAALRGYVACDGSASGDVVSGPLKETLDSLLLQGFVASTGVRYLPSFAGESLLVEVFPEDEVRDRDPLLEALGLRSRRNRSRLEIEEALQAHDEEILSSHLGLDPDAFALVCIPFDAYLRLAPEHRWGERELWTHFDGYRVVHGARLRALVGGDVRYGGPADLAAVGLDYAHDRILARFAVARRRRLTMD